MYKIIPGILEKDSLEIEKKIEQVKHFANTLHIDLIDGIFAQNTTFLDPTFFTKYAKDFNLEVHLMVSDPLKYLEPFASAGFRRFIAHVEMLTNTEEFVARGQLLGEVGLALDLDTELSKITVSLEDLDVILLMGVKAGLSGQVFNPKVLEKIKSLKEKSFVPIEVDGGVNDTNIVDLKNAGAERFVTTSFLFQEDPVRAFEKLNNLIIS
jgi:ribulose-phosphate 3-epimerase